MQEVHLTVIDSESLVLFMVLLVIIKSCDLLFYYDGPHGQI